MGGMALRSGSGASDYSRRVNAAVRQLTARAGLSNNELIRRSGMSLNYFYTRMRGEATFDTNDLDSIAQVLDIDVADIIATADRIGVAPEAAAESEDAERTARVTVNGYELARRMRVLLGSALTSEGIPGIPAERLETLLNAAETFHARRAELEAVARYLDIPAAFLLDTSPSASAARIEAEIDLRHALREQGAQPVAARALGGLNAQAIRAVAASVRSIRKQ